MSGGMLYDDTAQMIVFLVINEVRLSICVPNICT